MNLNQLHNMLVVEHTTAKAKSLYYHDIYMKENDSVKASVISGICQTWNNLRDNLEQDLETIHATLNHKPNPAR